MSELHTTDVPGWVHPEVQGEVISDEGVPAWAKLPDNISPVVIHESVSDKFPQSQYVLESISPHHGRSYELVGRKQDLNLGRIALWKDDCDQVYTSHSTKGNNFSMNSIMESATAPSGYIPQGLLESDALLRVIRTSRILRENNISTEWISRVFEPEKLIYQGEMVSQTEYKQRLLEDTMRTKGLVEMAKIAKAIEPMTFFITNRSMEINDRLLDFVHDDKDASFARLERIFTAYNATHQNDDTFKELKVGSEKDRKRFFNQLFPNLLGTNLAKLHNLGIVHTFPTTSNVNILGGLIDLDSFRGVPLNLGDEQITLADRVRDLRTFVDNKRPDRDLLTIYSKLEDNDVISSAAESLVSVETELLTAYENTTELNKEQNPIIDLYSQSAFNYAHSHNIIKSMKEVLKDEDYLRELILRVTNSMDSYISHHWSDSHIRLEVAQFFDVYLRTLAKEEATLDEPASLYINRELRQRFTTSLYGLKRGSHDAFSRHLVGEMIKADMELIAPLAEAVPEEDIRNNVLESFVTLTADTYYDDYLEQVSPQKRVGSIRRAVNKFFDNDVMIRDSDWEAYIKDMPGFEFIVDKQPSAYEVFNRKSVLAHSGVNLMDLLHFTKQAGIRSEIMTEPIKGPTWWPDSSETVRHQFTDSENVGMISMLAYMEPSKPPQRVLLTLGLDMESKYVAWVVEPKEVGASPYIVIKHVDGKAAESSLGLI